METTEQQAVEEVIEEESTQQIVDDMSDEDLDNYLDGDTETVEDSEDEQQEELSDDDLYRKQIDDKEAKLDRDIVLKYNGEIYKVNSVDELRSLAEKGMNATKKFQKLAEDRKALEAQLKELGQEPQVDDTSTEDEINRVAEQILSSSYAEQFQVDISKLPQEVSHQLKGDVRLLDGLRGDYESGLAQKIMPKVDRLMNINGMSFLEAYKRAGSSLQQQTKEVETKKQVLKSQPKQNTNQTQSINVDDMSESEFDRYFDSL